MIILRYFIVGDGPLAERYYELLLCGGDVLDALEVLGHGFRDRACVDGVSFVYKPNLVEVRSHLVLCVPEYREAARDVFDPPDYLTEMRKWGVLRLAQDGVIDAAAIVKRVNGGLALRRPEFA